MVCAAFVSGRWLRGGKFRELKKRHGNLFFEILILPINKTMYIDLLTKIKNAQAVKKESIKTHYSKIDEGVLEILKKNKIIENFEKKGRGVKKILSVDLKYENNEGVISGIKILSRPGRRIYLGYREIRLVRSGFGFLVLSTPKGIMTGREARKNKIGGEAMFEIW